MAWRESTQVSEREEFVHRARQEGTNLSALCREYGISRKTGYKWLQRFAQAGAAGLQDASRRPHRSPQRTEASQEAAVLRVRQAHPAWGARKIYRVLEREGHGGLPALSTICAILRRGGCIDPAEAAKHRVYQRFERERPNELWQMDFKGHFPLEDGCRCHPLTVLDDHSRFNLGLRACADEQTQTVRQELVRIFCCYGLPEALLTDNGPPWGGGAESRFTPLCVWLIRLGIVVRHGRPYHPQTQGKVDHFHRTLMREEIRGSRYSDYADCQARFDRYRTCYNEERPHQALGMQVPADRYQRSPRSLPAKLPAVEYPAGSVVRKVQQKGWISFQGTEYRVPKAFYGQLVALRPTGTAGEMGVYFCQQKIATLDLRHYLTGLPPESGC